jgi:hypothetical protein
LASILLVTVAFAALSCGETTEDSASATHAKDAARASNRLAANERVLSRAQSERLVGWATELVSCANDRGIDVRPPSTSSRQISMAVERAAPEPRKLRALVIACAESLGDPPTGASLQVFARQLVLYLPLRCLLDPKVEREHWGT